MAMDLSIAMLKTTEQCLHISKGSCFQSEVLYTDNHMKFLDSKEAPGDSHWGAGGAAVVKAGGGHIVLIKVPDHLSSCYTYRF